MEPIQNNLKRWMRENKDFKSIYENMKNRILNDADIKAFLLAHPEISQAEIERNLNKLHEYTTQSVLCNKCQSYGKCINNLQGYSPVLDVVRDEVHITYEKCPNHIAYEKQVEKQSLVQSLYVPKEILQANLKNIYSDEGRLEAVRKMMDFIEKAKTELPERGIYFTGSFGVGKTYFLGALANRLKQLDYASTIIYMPEFVQEMKSSINDNTVQQKVDYYKTADILMLDDIGAETMSAWFRDEILGSILQYRMMEGLPVFFTSNYKLDELEKILSTSTKGNIEEIKAGRIMERIKQVSDEVVIYGQNRRK